MHHPRSASESDVPSALVRAELDRILASEVFSRSDRLSAFLHFIVEQTLAGQGDSLKEHVIAVELYGKSTDFNTAADPIVRVDARRLRDKLREYYASAPDDAILISVPKGTYHTGVRDKRVRGATKRGRDSRSATRDCRRDRAMVALTGGHRCSSAYWPHSARHWPGVARAIAAVASALLHGDSVSGVGRTPGHFAGRKLRRVCANWTRHVGPQRSLGQGR